MSAVTATKFDATHLPEPTQAPSNNLWHTIGKIALKVLSMTSIIVGSAAALTGAIVVTKIVIGTGILAPLLIPCVIAAIEITKFSYILLSNEVTALGVMFTLPFAGVCLAPFLLPAAVGALPGAGLIGLGAWGWESLNN